MQKTTILFLTALLFSACSIRPPVKYMENPNSPAVFPHNTDSITIPINIAPLNFSFSDSIDDAIVIVSGKSTTIRLKGREIIFPAKEWKKMLNQTGEIKIQAYTKQDKQWTRHRPLTWFVSPDSIDPYITYRLIGKDYPPCLMGVYQRNLESYKEKTLLVNTQTGNTCFNCHSSAGGNANTFVMLLRDPSEGAILSQNGRLSKISPKANSRNRLVYTSFHPGGKHITFTTNNFKGQNIIDPQYHFYTLIDSSSYIVHYNIETNTLTNPEPLSDTNYIYSYMAWSGKGKKLYFCRSPKPKENVPLYEKLLSYHYGIYSLSFNEKTGTFDNNSLEEVISDTVLYKSTGRGNFQTLCLSGDDKKLICTLSKRAGNTALHNDVLLVEKNLVTGQMRILNELTTPNKKGESWASWQSFSSNGKWLMFVSKRMDGLFSYIYFSHVNSNGTYGKPFILPQKEGAYYKDFFRNYNLPGFSTNGFSGTAAEIAETKNTKAKIITEK